MSKYVSLDTSSFISRLKRHDLTGISQVAPLQAGKVTMRMAAPSRTDVRTVAVMVTHGMGQQVPFETCAAIAEAFVRGKREPSGAPQANRVQLAPNADLVARMELIYAADTASNQPETHVHIYEGYWAPLTEGKISLAQTIDFLFGAGLRGIGTYLQKSPPTVDNPEGRRRNFTRWVFKDLHSFQIKRHTFGLLLWVILFLLLGVVAGLFCEWALKHTWDALRDAWEKRQFLLVFSALFQHAIWNTLRILGLAFAGAYLYYTRYFLIEFVGDVAIYVSSFKVSQYQEVRDAIQARVMSVGKQIVSAPDPEDSQRPLYDSLVFVGHSLGSVITYDLVNALLVFDGCGAPYPIHNRIKTLITFGSPLDKTAFLFRTQTSPKHHYREALAGLMQPLILDYAMRTFPWINIHSHLDPVSGALAYYDWPPAPRTASAQLGSQRSVVQNKIDPECSIPALAHVQYWNNSLLTRELHDAIER